MVVGCATGAWKCTTITHTAWKVPFIHNAFENSAATVSGVEAAYRSLKRRGKIDKKIDFIAFGGDGGTYDIGFQSLSGAMERGHDMLYICYDNQAYMNTGIQRSSATPRGANTTTSPAGSESYGEALQEPDRSHGGSRYPLRGAELAGHVERPGIQSEQGPCRGRTGLHDGHPSHAFWGGNAPSDQTIELARLAVDTCFWPLYEVVEGE